MVPSFPGCLRSAILGSSQGWGKAGVCLEDNQDWRLRMGPLQCTYESPQEPPRLALLMAPQLPIGISGSDRDTPPAAFTPSLHLGAPRLKHPDFWQRAAAGIYAEAETEPDGDRRWPLEGTPPRGCFSDGWFHQEFFTSQIWGTYMRPSDRGHLPPDSARISGGRGAPRGKGLKRERARAAAGPGHPWGRVHRWLSLFC